ncbi:heme NO-binding domain-containing protein [Thioalkalivibrio sp. ALJ7]|uniref:heme NO-binding domain-containing protein n=1 Tax=Thioalkalivibrio sp. ALJ7 TaxID=1158756 RepID=UPI00037FFB6A|nr:heme NO-binding domain-containing protein [Thioalkalivibrio sp. ALJ7]
MKGVVFNVLEEIVTEHYGTDTWEDLLDHAKLSGAYTSLGNYDDTDMLKLVEAASATTGMDEATCLRWIGREMLPRFESIYPGVFEDYPDTIALLRALNDVIHPEVTKLYPGAIVPIFHYHKVAEDQLMMEYDSQRQLCSLAHGLMLGAGDRYGQTLRVEHHECVHRGDARCLFDIRAEGSIG